MEERWRQRFQNFKRAFGLLREATEERKDFTQLEREGVIQRFEYTFELGCKVLKDYLEHSGIVFTEATPRNIIKLCASSGIFDEAGIDAQVFINMLLARNALSHRYDIEFFEKVFTEIQFAYVCELGKEYLFFLGKIADEAGNV